MPLAPTTPAPRDRREEILLATLRVIGEGGVDAVTHRRVAEIAGFSHGSITYHFASREALVREAFRFYIADLRASIQAVEKALADDRHATWVDAIVALSARDLEQPALARAEYEMYVFAARDAETASDVERWDAAIDVGFARHLEEAGIARPIEGARALRGTIRGFELERLSRPVPLDELRRRLQLVLAGLLDQGDAEPPL